MALFVSGSEARLGSLNLEPFLAPPPLPNIVAEWAAILPLVIHLASYREDYTIAGEVALQGGLSVGLFPRLGTLSAFTRLLSRGREFMEQAGHQGGACRTVWDVRWGSVFPGANGAATVATLMLLFAPGRFEPIKMPGVAGYVERAKHSEKAASSAASASATGAFRDVTSTASKLASFISYKRLNASSVQALHHSRNQHLHVIRYQQQRHRKASFIRTIMYQYTRTKVYDGLVVVIMVMVAACLCLAGVYGTAASLVLGAISRLFSRAVKIDRPTSYLSNNEAHDAYFLMAAHQNSLDWYLHIGDRSVVDTMLNKPMIEIPVCTANFLAAKWFGLANLLQLLAMTYVAAQRGWDGIGLIVLVALDRIIQWSSRGDALTRYWLEKEGISIEGKSFVFSGRSMLMGALQLHSKSEVTRWMDGILVPHPRREAFLKRLKNGPNYKTEAAATLNQGDHSWIDFATKFSFECAQVLSAELDKEDV